MQASAILHIVKARATAAESTASRQHRMWTAAFELWNDEYYSWRALADLGHQDAARCAWERRSAAAEVSHILTVCG